MLSYGSNDFFSVCSSYMAALFQVCRFPATSCKRNMIFFMLLVEAIAELQTAST